MTVYALFRPEGDELVPQEIARSPWGEAQMTGIATSAALARELEAGLAGLGRGDLRPARYTVDMFRSPTMSPVRARSRVVREGSRLALIDAVLEQDGQPVARASGLFLAPGTEPDGVVWTPTEQPSPPPLEQAPVSDRPRVPFLSSEPVPWSQNFADHQNGNRKQTWQVALGVVVGEDPSPFQCAAGVADATSMVVNWGSGGVQFINTDITLSLARLPVSREVGLSVLTRTSYDGIATGTAVMFDREGPIGTTTVTALANARRSVDFENYDVTARARSAD